MSNAPLIWGAEEETTSSFSDGAGTSPGCETPRDIGGGGGSVDSLVIGLGDAFVLV